MPGKIVIIGAGLIGAALAEALTRQGREVLIVEGGLPGQGASGRSFGWVNASYFANDAHFQLRRDSMEAWRRLYERIPELSLSWSGSLWWAKDMAELEAMTRQLTALDYPVERIGADQIRLLCPVLSEPPDEALILPQEGVAEAEEVTSQLLAVACAQGAQVITGCPVTGIKARSGRVQSILCEAGEIAAEQVIMAAGNGTASLLADLGVNLPMLRRPGALMISGPVAPALSRVMVSPELEFRQDKVGRIIAPSAAAHQRDETDHMIQTPDALAADTIARLHHLMPDISLHWQQVTQAFRPVPGDGLPVIGRCGPEGLYVAVMHSGVTLAAGVAQLAAREILKGEDVAMLASFRPGRFTAKG